jgi:hypothetical protein
MKKLIIFVLLVGVGYFAYQQFLVKNVSEEQKQVQAIADEFQTARQRLGQAERSAAVGGVDTTSDVDDAMAAVRALKEKLQTLNEKLGEEKAIAMAGKLAGEMQSFLENKGK